MEIHRLDSAIGIALRSQSPADDATADSQQHPQFVEDSPQTLAKAHSAPRAHTQQQSRLLSLPVELQLQIWEYTVLHPEPLLLNCPCDSSYGGWTAAYHAAKQAWASRAAKPPAQPALTLVCRAIRVAALPLFYQLNAFRAGYCVEADMELAVRWLDMIGAGNRRELRRFELFDGNAQYDRENERYLTMVRRGKIVRGMGGRLENRSGVDGCRHRVLFGEGEVFEGVERLFCYEKG